MKRSLGLFTLSTLALLAVGLALGATEKRPTLTTEIQTFLRETEAYAVPDPDAMQSVDHLLLGHAADVQARYAPTPAEAQQAARFALLRSIQRGIGARVLAHEHFVSVGAVWDPQRQDWRARFSTPLDVDADQAKATLQTLGVLDALSGFELDVVAMGPLRAASGERPGRTSIWAGVQRTIDGQTACGGIGSMGWLVESNQIDEEKPGGSTTGSASIGYLTAMHVTAAGDNHRFENYATLDREIKWGSGEFCPGFTPSGQVLRLGPHEMAAGFDDIAHDIDFVSMYEEQACKQAREDADDEGLPTCPGFEQAIAGRNFIADPVAISEATPLAYAEVQACGIVTGDTVIAELAGFEFLTELAVFDWDGDPVNEPGGSSQATLHLEDLWRIEPGSGGDPEIADVGDSGGPVWIYDFNAMDLEGAFRPLGTIAVLAQRPDGSDIMLATSLPTNLDAFDVNLILDNPRNPKSDKCETTCECDCDRDFLTVPPEAGRRLLQTAQANGPKAVSHLTRLAVDHRGELLSLATKPGSLQVQSLFATQLAPLLERAFAAKGERAVLDLDATNAARAGLAWVYHNVESETLRTEIARFYRFASVYLEGRTVQEALRLFLAAVEPTSAEK